MSCGWGECRAQVVVGHIWVVRVGVDWVVRVGWGTGGRGVEEVPFVGGASQIVEESVWGDGGMGLWRVLVKGSAWEYGEYL